MSRFALTILGVALSTARSEAADSPPLAEYFQIEVAKIAARPLLGIKTAEDWKAARPELQRKLVEMLGLDPRDVLPIPLKGGDSFPVSPGTPPASPPEFLATEEPVTAFRGDVLAEIKGKVERPDFTIEKILYQSKPGLYVTANLYRPKIVTTPLPAILYVCGHSKVEKDGIIYGCKAHYQHHAAWYASNGYVCLVLDTLQLGEVPGLHHGTYRFGMWGWPARGYTPAGIEAWNAIRGIDYLMTRPEVDKNKIGVTGRSGGGATSWWVGAIDDRVATVIPVAGITDLKNHVVDGVVEGHCDCMYPVNTERWDFEVIAALVAPKALLVENTDKDPIFPEDGVRRIYSQLETVYGWYGAKEKLGLVIGKGGHGDTQELRHPSFAFMDRWLKGVERPIVEPDRHVPIELLTVLGGTRLPRDAKNATIHETARGTPGWAKIDSIEAFAAQTSIWRKELNERVFAGWPTSDQAGSLHVKRTTDSNRGPIRIRGFEFQSQPGITLRLWSIDRAGDDRDPARVRVMVVDPLNWTTTWAAIVGSTENTAPISVGDGSPVWVEARSRVVAGDRLILIVPRGVGPTAWPIEKDKQIRRRFLLLGQTLDGMRAWDAHRGIVAAQELSLIPSLGPQTPDDRVYAAEGEATTWLLWAMVQGEPTRGTVELSSLPTNMTDGPAYLNLEAILDMPEAVTLLFPATVRLRKTSGLPWSWTQNVGGIIAGTRWPQLQ